MELSGKRPVVHLHLGAMKTGTTHLQELMVANANEMDAAGVLFPLKGNRYNQTMAVRDVLNMPGDPVGLKKSRGEWDRTVDRLTGYDGKASIFSMEFLSFAHRPGAKRVVGSFGDADLRLILTVRDSASAIPAQWQQAMQSQRATSWSDFIEQIRASHSEPDTWGAKTFHRAQDVPRMLETWLTQVPPERLTVVTVPRPGSPRSLLWERFCEAVELDPSVAIHEAPRNNESIGAASAELLRRVNENLMDVPISDYRGTMRHVLAHRFLSHRASAEGKAPVNNAFREFAAATNARTRAAVEATGVRVIGDLDDLPTEAPAAAADDGPLPAPADEAVIAAAAYAIPHMRQVVEHRARGLRKTPGKVPVRKLLADLPDARDEDAVLRRWHETADPVDTAISDMTAVCREAISLAVQLREAGHPPIV